MLDGYMLYFVNATDDEYDEYASVMISEELDRINSDPNYKDAFISSYLNNNCK